LLPALEREGSVREGARRGPRGAARSDRGRAVEGRRGEHDDAARDHRRWRRVARPLEQADARARDGGVRAFSRRKKGERRRARRAGVASGMAKRTGKRGGENVADAQRKSGGPRKGGRNWTGGKFSQGTRGTELDE